MNRKLSPVAFSIILAILLGSMAGAATRLASPWNASGMSLSGLAPLAAVGSGFTYQGRLLSGGNPANGNHDFTFKLFDLPTGGNQVGSTITLTNQTVTNGIFTISLHFRSDASCG